jgi:hypothetical protein
LRPLANSRAIAIVLSMVFAVGVGPPLPASSPGPRRPQTASCRHNAWQVLAGSIENVDVDDRSFDIQVRSGSQEIPGSLEHRISHGQNPFAKTEISIDDFHFQTHASPSPEKTVSFSKSTKVFRLKASELVDASQSEIKGGTSALLVLEPGNCWPSSADENLSSTTGLKVRAVIVLDACVEASCKKEHCKGSKDCAEPVCNCPHKT